MFILSSLSQLVAAGNEEMCSAQMLYLPCASHVWLVYQALGKVLITTEAQTFQALS